MLPAMRLLLPVSVTYAIPKSHLVGLLIRTSFGADFVGVLRKQSLRKELEFKSLF